MPCPQCGAESMAGATGLCEPHFEAQRAAIREKLSEQGPVPVAKALPSRVDASKNAAGNVPKSGLFGLLVTIVFLVAVFSNMRDGNDGVPVSFRDSSVGETWQINSSDVVLLSQPRLGANHLEFAAMLITGVPSGASVRVLGGSRSDPWKYVVLEKGGRSLEGYILSEAVSSASQTN